MRRLGDPLRVRGGFTLVELMAALALAGVVLLGAWALMVQLGDARDRLESDDARVGAGANGERLLYALIERSEAGGDSSERFVGDERRASFVSWCDVPAGWLERCRASLTIVGIGDSSAIEAVLGTGDTLRLWSRAGAAGFRYRDGRALDSAWRRSWGTSIALPAAVAILTGSDTLLAQAGGRP